MKYTLLVLVLMIGLFSGCTENQRARNFGGTSEIVLPKNKKLIIATWKNDSLWYLTREMKADEQPESYVFKEDSSFGVMQGQVIFKETK